MNPRLRVVLAGFSLVFAGLSLEGSTAPVQPEGIHAEAIAGARGPAHPVSELLATAALVEAHPLNNTPSSQAV
ncbi:MAG TPA: hypothetical protein VLE99_01500 [Candidatus Saccharimonadales bacterium]|nr:hypothetical protein [Candidatus Saccharimonadales bacterium]